MNYEIRGETPKEKITYAGDPEIMQKMIDEENEKDATASDTKRIVIQTFGCQKWRGLS